MTILAQNIEESAAALPRVPVDVVVRVVAAGIARTGSRDKPVYVARATLALTPVAAQATDSGAIDFADWPTAVGELLSPGAMFDVQVVAVGPNGGRTPSGLDTSSPKMLRMKVRSHPVNDVELRHYWRAVMGDATEIESLTGALGTGAAALDKVLRSPEGGGPRTIPDIHGSGRSEAAVALSLERAKQILERLAGRPAATRAVAVDEMPERVRSATSTLLRAAGETALAMAPAAPTDPAVSDLAKAAMQSAVRGIKRVLDEAKAKGTGEEELRSLREDLVQQAVRQVLGDEDAWKALQTSRQRADANAKARLDYLEAKNSEDAVRALAATACHFGRRTPFAVAAALQSATPAGPQISEAHASHRLASRTPGPDGHDAKLPADVETESESGKMREFARRRFFALQASPSLARLFRFVVDLECPADDLFTAAAGPAGAFMEPNVFDHDAPGRYPVREPVENERVETRFVFLGAQIQRLDGAAERLPQIWTTAKLRHRTGASEAHFYPCAREEIDAWAAKRELRGLAIAEQIDTLIDLGQQADCGGRPEPRFDILTLDAITSTAADIHFEQVRAQRNTALKRVRENEEYLPADVIQDAEEQRNATLRTGGLAVVDRWRQSYAIARHRAAQRQHQARKDNVPMLLDASDLTIGYKLDVGVRRSKGQRRHWHTLMRRTVHFNEDKQVWLPARSLDATISALYPDTLSRLRADDGVLTVPAALRELDPNAKETQAAAFAEEIIGAWRGDPLGLATGVETLRLHSRDLRIGMTLSLPTRSDGSNAEAFTPPPLRFGWRYHFGMRAVFAGGISMPLERALGHYERSHDGGLIMPAAGESGRAFRRHERLDFPRVAVPDWVFGDDVSEPGAHRRTVRLRNRFGAEQALRMMVRTVTDAENRAVLGLPANNSEGADIPGVGLARRVLMVPPVALDFAGLHDAFRAARIDDKEFVLFEPRVLHDSSGEPGDKNDRPEPGEGLRVELVAAQENNKEIWKEARVAWRASKVASRPFGGLKGIDYHAAWGGFPVFRMKTTDPAIKPQEGQPVFRQGAVITDTGEILDRVEGLDPVMFNALPGQGQARKVNVEWQAIGGTPSGDSVFRPLAAGRAQERERLPYYPDPGTSSLVIEVSVRGKNNATPLRRKSVIAKVYDAEPTGPVAAGYPDATPVVVDVIRVDKPESGPLISLGNGAGANVDYLSLPLTPQLVKAGGPYARIPVRHVVVRLAPGEEATIRAWCLPNLSFLTHMFEGTEAVAALAVACGCLSLAELTDASAIDAACRAGFTTLCGVTLPSAAPGAPSGPAVGGLITPTQPQIEAIARLIHLFMQREPLPEIAATVEIEAVHATDRPLLAPELVASVPPPTSLPLLRADADLVRSVLTDASHPLYRSESWDMSVQPAGAVGVLLDGRVKLHAPSSNTIEIRASGAAAARGRFDDAERGRSHDDRVRGLWPKPDGVKLLEARKLFGFVPHADGRVDLMRENVTLLRIEGFTPEVTHIDLLTAQRDAFAAEAALRAGKQVVEEHRTLRAQRPAAFPDGRARHLDVTMVATARNTSLLRTRYDELPEHVSMPEADKVTVLARQWLPATVRPARIAPQSVIPSFIWREFTNETRIPKLKEFRSNWVSKNVGVTRRTRIRVRMRRPWFSSGEGERIGIVVWPPDLFRMSAEDIQADVVRELVPGRDAINVTRLPSDDDGNSDALDLQDSDLGPGGAWVTRWGGDPIRSGYPVAGWLMSAANFTGARILADADWQVPPERRVPEAAVVVNALMPLPASEDADPSVAVEPPGGFMSVALVTYEARFDAEQELWYADVDIDPLDATLPFVRLGLVRFQPHASRKLQVSEPVAEWVQILPERTVSASAELKAADVEIAIRTKGAASHRGVKEARPETSSTQQPLVRMTLLCRSVEEDGTAETVTATSEAQSKVVPGGLEWTHRCTLPAEQFHDERFDWSVFVDEVERLRPATYPDEPRYRSNDDTLFTETGPRFAARLELRALRPVLPIHTTDDGS